LTSVENVAPRSPDTFLLPVSANAFLPNADGAAYAAAPSAFYACFPPGFEEADRGLSASRHHRRRAPGAFF
jgi:hypothetical protein